MVAHLEAGLLVDMDMDTCIGLGAAICSRIAQVSASVTGYVGNTHTKSYSDERADSISMSYSFEYTTSEDIEKAGNRSDMFLTPSLNVKFAKSADISFNKSTCSAAYKEIVTWNLDSESNVPVCAFDGACWLLHLIKFGHWRVGVCMAQCRGRADHHYSIP